MKPVYFDSQIPEKIAKEEFCFPEGIMMENAASSLQNVITDACNEQKLLNPCVLIVCGSGNNGGDGIALARRIFGKFEVYVFCVKNPKTPESLVQLKMAKKLNVPFGVIDLSLAPTPAEGDSVAGIFQAMGLEHAGAHGTTAALAMLNDAVKNGKKSRRLY